MSSVKIQYISFRYDEPGKGAPSYSVAHVYENKGRVKLSPEEIKALRDFLADIEVDDFA